MTPVVNLKRLKRWANEHLPANSPLRCVIAADEDELRAEDFVGKTGLYLRLAHEELDG